MGTLVARKYPTKLFLKAADHTYVECGSGAKAWSCWGGKTGGTAFNSGTGSTVRADAIAEPDERAGITCYLVSGVCHQAANRILLPAGILVSAARGYSLSVAIFGIYGRVGSGPCHAPFNQHPGLTGDLPVCIGTPAGGTLSRAKTAIPPRQSAHLRSIRSSYSRLGSEAATPLDAMMINVRMFEREVDFRFKRQLPKKAMRGLREAKVKVELEHHHLGESFQRKSLGPIEFVVAFNAMTDRFQADAANALSAAQYKTLFQMGRDDRLVLADPDAIDANFGAGTAAAVYGTQLRQ
ncbi:MAG TPA: hypothetical protein VMG60_14645 [Burkholderiaceae bacterium]|nr:hypothetical protein [Burkholderiaceae bacterium]